VQFAPACVQTACYAFALHFLSIFILSFQYFFWLRWLGGSFAISALCCWFERIANVPPIA